MRSQLALAFLSVLLLGACSNSPLDVSDPDFRGVIEQVFPQVDGVAVRLIDVEPTPVVRVVLVDGRTTIVVRHPSGSLKSGALSDLQPGRVLRVKRTGPVLLTDPPQYHAVWVEIILPPAE